MYARLLEPPTRQSFFLFGPRGVGKTAWLRERFRDAPFFDLLDAGTYTRLLAAPTRLGDEIPAGYRGWVICLGGASFDSSPRHPALCLRRIRENA